ncbi:MAG: glycosyltransferase [Candidatus Omnitrophica bacterium]|nr:glycosyltransferase [Candidatus Omnitrophota bacterium]
MKVSLVLAYYNRRRSLINTLNSIEYYNKDRDIEVIIVDDCSSEPERIDDLPAKYKIPVYVIPVTQEFKRKSWSCPVITFNIGFNYVTGDIVIIQNPENLHVGDIVGSTLDNMRKNTYLSFGCYSMTEKDTDSLHNKINKAKNFTGEFIKKSVGKFEGFVNPWKDGDNCWYNHSVYRPGFNYFCCAMPRKDLEELSGFDERYAHGFAYDDCELLIRIARKPMFQKHIDDPFVIHQFHPVSDYKKNAVPTERNRQLYMKLTCAGTFVNVSATNRFFNPKTNFKR